MAKAKEKKVRITLKRSNIGRLQKQIDTIKALGLTKIGQSKEFVDTPTLQGMIKVVAHMIEVEEI